MAKQGLTIQKSHWPLVLGLDIEDTYLKYVLLRHKSKTVQILKFGKHRIPVSNDGRPVFEKQLLFKLFGSTVPSKGVKIVLGLEGQGVVTKHSTYPTLPKKELLQTIAFEIQSEMGIEEDAVELVTDYRKLGMNSDSTNLFDYIALGSTLDTIKNKLEPLVEMGVIPHKIIPNTVAISNLLPFIPELTQYRNVGILDIGSRSSIFMILREGRLFFLRDILVGADDFTRAITGTIFHEGKAIQFSNDEATEFLKKFGYPIGFSEGMMFQGAPLAEVGALMRPVVERLTGEIQRSVDFYSEKAESEKVDALFLLGDGANLKHLHEVLFERIQIPVNPLPLPELIHFQGGKRQQQVFMKHFLELSISLSLALESNQDCNLLPIYYQRIQQQQTLKKSAQIISFGLAIIMIILTIGIQNKYKKIQGEVDILESRTANIKGTGKQFSLLLTQKDLLEKQIQTVQQQIQYDDEIIQILKLVTNTIPDNLPLIAIEYQQEVVKQNKNRNNQEEVKPKWVLKIKGANRHPKNDIRIYLGKFIMELKKSGFFSDVELSNEIFDMESKEYGFEITSIMNKG